MAFWATFISPRSTSRNCSYPAGIGTSNVTSIRLPGHDLAGELLGNIGFGKWLATQQRPTPQQVRMFDAMLVSLADHGFTPTAIAARLTLYSAPDALQGTTVVLLR